MTAEVADAIVVGMCPGGEDAATRMAQEGLSVIGVEGNLVGGECPYYACVPTKMMIRAANSLAEAHRVAALAGSVSVRPDWAPVAARIRAEATDNWDDTVAVERFENAGGRFIRGWGRITAPGAVTVATESGPRLLRAAKAIVLNPGSAPAIPPIPGLRETPYWTNRDAVATTTVPESLIVLGGGPVACEFSQVFARFGTSVTVLVRSRLLSRDEPEAGALIGDVLTGEGVTIHRGASATLVEHDGHQFTVHLEGGDPVRARNLLIATGRHTDLAALGVGAVGVDDTASTIRVDDRMRAADGVWAIGDVTGRGAFTHMSMYQARIAVADILGRPGEPADSRAVPRVTFTDPEVGAVGLSESAARAAGIPVRTGRSDIPQSARGWIHKAGNEGFIKVLADTDRGVLVGATSVGPVGGEVLATLTLAVHARVPIGRLRRMIYAYPTFHRAIESALEDLGELMPDGATQRVTT